ncbi:MAG: iron-sulfur cluster assembly scaffold protein [Candidatus Helarchaeota archaeon]
MADDFDEFIKNLQAEIDAKEELEFSKEVLKEYRNPSNVGIIENPDAEAKYRGTCGDTMHFTFRTQDGIIKEMKFMTDGCGPTIACGSKLSKIVKNLPIKDALLITKEDLMKSLNGLPPDHEHCALLAVLTLKEAFNKGY